MKEHVISISVVAAIVTLAGCAATTTPETDARLGEAFSVLRAQQTLNPEASGNQNPVLGMDGKSAKGALDNYQDSFRKPPAEAQGSVVIGVGGAK